MGVHESEKLWTNCGHVSNMCQICVEMRTGNLGGIDGLNTFWLLVLVQTCLENVNLRWKNLVNALWLCCRRNMAAIINKGSIYYLQWAWGDISFLLKVLKISSLMKQTYTIRIEMVIILFGFLRRISLHVSQGLCVSVNMTLDNTTMVIWFTLQSSAQ